LVALAVAIALALVGDVGVIVARRKPAPARTEVARRPPDALQAVLPELEAFVARTRGLPFKSLPKVELLGDDRFEALLQEGDDTDSPEQQALHDEAFVGLLRALGLVEGNVDLDAVANEAVSDVVGFYDSQAKVLYARGVKPTAYVKDVLVHELTHALDDQHFGLDRDMDDEASAAFEALVEGSATVVEERWYDSRPEAERDAIDRVDGVGAPPEDDSSADVFTRLFEFPYAAGTRFVQALLDARGPAGVDAAFVQPPVDTEQIIHPDRFLAGEGARPVAEPAAEGRVVDHGVLGELGLLLVLDTAIDHPSALRAAAGWGGDRYVTWAGPRGATCVRWDIVMDTARDTAEILAGLRAWAGTRPSATVRGTDPVVVTSCG
jgi:hypothetical protein